MWTYYWYLVEKSSLPDYKNEEGEWVLSCPDFPKCFIADKTLGPHHWNSKHFRDRAQSLTEFVMKAMMLRGDTIPTPQKQMPNHPSFAVHIIYEQEKD